MTERTVAIMQPSYMPWLGHFDMMRRSDIYVFYDDAAYDKGGWRNRNRIRAKVGWKWLTIPVYTKGRFGQPLNMVETKGNQWARNHIKTLDQYYQDAPYWSGYRPVLQALLVQQDWPYLVNVAMATTRLMQKWLGLGTQVVIGSQLGADGTSSTAKLLGMLERLGATRYIASDASRTYLNVEMLNNAGIEVEFQNYKPKPYPQVHGGAFVSHLSALDLILNHGPNAKEFL